MADHVSKEATRLTIGIPTYNFGAYIGETLASIVPQLRSGVEITILDGGSTDDTDEIVAQWQNREPRIAYHRQGARCGIDRDMARVMELAEGDYCWLLSADDIVRPGAIDTVLAHLSAASDVVLLTHRNCTFDMKVSAGPHPVLDCDDARFDISSSSAREHYFALAKTTEAFFSFISGLVVRRSVWRPETVDDRFYGSCWAHAARLLRIMSERGLSIDYIAEPLVDRRGDNDSFRSNGVVRRYGLAIQGYQTIVADIFGPDSSEAQHIRRVLRNEFDLKMLLHAKSACRRNSQLEEQALLNTLAASIHCDGRSKFTYLLFRSVPAWLFDIGLKVVPPAKAALRRLSA